MTKYQLVSAPDGSILLQPFHSLEPEPDPEPDGRYYLLPGDRATALAWELFERGLPVYCGRCRAQLKISRAYVLCSNDDHHFDVIV
jgi:hypothetical protein